MTWKVSTECQVMLLSFNGQFLTSLFLNLTVEIVTVSSAWRRSRPPSHSLIPMRLVLSPGRDGKIKSRTLYSQVSGEVQIGLYMSRYWLGFLFFQQEPCMNPTFPRNIRFTQRRKQMYVPGLVL